MDTIKDRRPKTEDRGQKTRIFPLLVAGVFFLNQINLSAAGILDYVDEPLKNYDEMMSDALRADMYIGNLNAVIGGENLNILSDTDNYRVETAVLGGLPLQVGADDIGKLGDNSKLIFKIVREGAEIGGANITTNDKLVAIVLPGTGTQFTDVVRHAPTGLESYTRNGDGAASQTFSDETKLDMEATGGGTQRTYNITAGDKSSQVTMRLKDGSSISMLRGASLSNMTFNNDNVGGGFDAAVVAASKGMISWKKKDDIILSMDTAGDIVIKGGSSFTTVDGKFLASKQGTIILGIGNGGVFDLGDGTKITATADSSITIKHGQWDLTDFQGTIETSGKSPGMSFAGVSIPDGALSKPIKLTASSNASFTLSAKGVIDTNLSASKGALTFTLNSLNGVPEANRTFTLQGATPTDSNKITLIVSDTNSSTQFTIENAKFKSSTKGELTLTLPADYTHVKKEETKGNFDIVPDGRENNINDRGITFANGLRFIYDLQPSLMSMTINPNGRYTVTSGPSAGTKLVIVANNAADSAVFVVGGAMITPKYQTGGAFGIKDDGKVDVNLSFLNETYDRRELEIAMPNSGTLNLANYTLTTAQAGTKLLVKNSKTDFTKSSGKFKIDATAGTPEFALNDEITVKALGAASFNIDSGNLDLAATTDGQTGKIQVSLANTKKAPANKTFTTTGGIQVTLNKLAEESAVLSSFKLVGVVTGMELALPGSNADISPDNLTGDVTITVPKTIDVDSALRIFLLDDVAITMKATAAKGQASFKLLNGIFSSSSSGELKFSMTTDKSIFIDSKDGVAEDPPALPNDITITTLTDATFKLVNGNIDFSGGTGNTKLVLGQGTRQLTVTLVDGSDLMVGAGKELTFVNGALNDSSTHIPGGTTRIVDSVTFINNSPDIEAVIGDNISSHPHDAIPNEWDFATLASYPGAAVTVDVKNATVAQTFKLRSQPTVNTADITIIVNATVEAPKSASFKVNADGTFGGWLSGQFDVQIANKKSLVLGTLDDPLTEEIEAANVTLTEGSVGSSSIGYGANGIDLTRFEGTVSLNNAPASKFVFAPGSLIKMLETESGMTTSLTITNGTPSSLISGTAVTVKDGTKVTLDTGIVLSMEGVNPTDEATVENGSITGASGKLTVTKPASITADQAFARIGEFDLNVIGGTLSSFTVELSGDQTNDKLSSISGNVVITVRKPDFEINGANGTVDIITVGNSVIFNGITFAPTQQQSLQNFSVVDGKVDLRNFDGTVTFNGAPAATFILKGVDADDGQNDGIAPDIELTASSDFTLTGGKLSTYTDKNNFALHAKDVLKLGDMTFEATGTADVSVSGSGNSYAFSETGDIKVSVANASADKTFTLNGMEFKVETAKSAVFTVASGSLGKYESGDITVTKSVVGVITINDVKIAGAIDDQFRLSNGKFDLTVPQSGITRTASLTVTSDKSATFLLANGIELTAKPVTRGDPPVTTSSIFVVAFDGQLDLSDAAMSGNFNLMLPKDLVTLGLSGLSSVTAKNGPATFDMTGNVVDLKTLRGSLEVTITNSTPIDLLKKVSITAPTSNATVLLANGNLDTFVSGRVQIQMAETTAELEGTPDTTIKFAATSVFGADSQVLYRKGAAGSLTIDSATSAIDFGGAGSGIFEVKLKGTGAVVPKVVLMNAEITPIAVGLAGSEKWLAEMIIKDRKLAATSKGDLEVRITDNSFKFKMLDGTRILNGPDDSVFKISNGRYAGLISLPAGLIADSGFRIELGSIITHGKNIDADPENEYEVKYIQNTKLEYLNMTDLPDVLNTDTDSVPGIAILKALQDIVIDGLGLVPANGILVFKNDNIILQSDEYYYALRVE